MAKGNNKNRNPHVGRLVKNDNLHLNEIRPLTPSQEDTFEAWDEGYSLCLHGKPGTGKTFLAMYLALSAINEGEYRRLVIVRSAVQGRDIGALPGTEAEKMAAYEAPYIGACSQLFGRADAYGIMKKKGVIEFCSTSYNRGITLDNCVILVDEAQNLSYQELDTIIGRVGAYSKIVFAGDTKQDDLTSKRKKEESGLPLFMKVIGNMEEMDFVEFGIEDIVRSGLVKSYIIAKDRLGL